MASSRAVLTPSKDKKPHKVFKRSGGITGAEKTFIAQFVADQPAEITPAQVTGLARTLRRSKEAIKNVIAEAREDFESDAKRYVEIHKTAVELALANGDSKSLEVAAKGARWAMENISSEGVRIVDKVVGGGPTGPKILIGINLGGVNKSEVVND